MKKAQSSGVAPRSSNEETMSPYEAAITMYNREHDRWNQWALFFFGSIVALFVLGGSLEKLFPPWVFCAPAAFLSLAWVVAGQNIRASTDSWRRVVLAIEKGEEVQVLTRHKVHCDNYNRWEDLERTLALGDSGVNSTRHSVSRISVLVGVVLFFVFSLVFVAGLLQLAKFPGFLIFIFVLAFFLVLLRFFKATIRKQARMFKGNLAIEAQQAVEEDR
jgi:Flp pilus assembly protein TadB